MSGAAATAGLEVTTGYSPLSFALALIRPMLQIDDWPPIQLPWGTNLLPVGAGRHQVRCWFRWGLFSNAGNAVHDVDVPEGAMLRLRYKAPTWFVFSSGRWTAEGGGPMPQPGAGWHPDPAGRHGLRYWDGSSWTAHVSTGGVVSTDG